MSLTGFSDKEDIARQFNVVLSDNMNILFAEYSSDNYEGSATVIYEQNGQLFEVHGSHCSCYGLEGQFSPEECSVEDILHRANNGNFSYVNNHEIKKVIEDWSLISTLGLSFDFDNLPDSNEIVEKFNIQEILNKKEYFNNQEDILKNIKKKISESIKKGVIESLSNVEVKEYLDINPILKKNLPIENLEKLIISEFKDIHNVLLTKNWKTNLSFKNNSIIFDINIPSLQQTTTKRKIKSAL